MERLTKKSQEIISTRLKLKDLSQVFERHSPETSKITKLPINRERTKLYIKNIRGSVRLNTGRFYTPEEWSERKKRIKSITLP